ncbi:hypothetical protein [Luteimonas suaedae]|uniref:hypothetical protein n=1 Tax=Luteimonas suaedae TaxID=2605430 RepID=UPI0011ECD577|nr:hypothetical protein [Luteimonas suaedae]
MNAAGQTWMERIEQLRAEGVINADDEAALIRHVNDHQRLIEEELFAIAPEYQRRLAGDGRQAADEWLAETARELGQREGEKMQRIFEQFSCTDWTLTA